MDDKTEGVVDILAALLVLFTALLDPPVSAGIAVVFLVGLSLYKFVQHRQQTTRM
jgi:hypothetical protein